MKPSSHPLPPWRPLLKAARQKEGRSPMNRWIQLATVAPDGSPRVRTLVFRGWRSANTLELLTDGRSAKADELAAEPRIELCWLLPKARCQFRLRGTLLHLDAEEQQQRQKQHWTALHPEGRALWAWPMPGEPFDTNAPFPAAIPDGTPPPDSFVLLSLDIVHVELLELTGTPHQRRRWIAQDGWSELTLNP